MLDSGVLDSRMLDDSVLNDSVLHDGVTGGSTFDDSVLGISGPDWCPSLGQCSRLEGFDSPRCLAFGLFLLGTIVENGMHSPIVHRTRAPLHPIKRCVRVPLSLLLAL